jgi:hypothetical protein
MCYMGYANVLLQQEYRAILSEDYQRVRPPYDLRKLAERVYLSSTTAQSKECQAS